MKWPDNDSYGLHHDIAPRFLSSSCHDSRCFLQDAPNHSSHSSILSNEWSNFMATNAYRACGFISVMGVRFIAPTKAAYPIHSKDQFFTQMMFVSLRTLVWKRLAVDDERPFRSANPNRGQSKPFPRIDIGDYLSFVGIPMLQLLSKGELGACL